MLSFILNNEEIATDLHVGTTVLDFVRYHKNLKGTKIGCREGDCGACTVLVGELIGDKVRYRTMTSCLMPLANAAGKHIVTVEGINPADGSLTPVQQAMLDASGTQCGFCTVGFVMSLTGFCIDETEKTHAMAVGAVDGNICRCTGYKSIERAARIVCDAVNRRRGDAGTVVPKYFADVATRLRSQPTQNPKSEIPNPKSVVGGGTDVYVQRPDALVEAESTHVFYDDSLRGITANDFFVEIGASATVTDLLESPVMQTIFPDLYKHLKLVSSTPIRNMATLAGNFINASPIGDMTAWFLALDASVIFSNGRELPLRELYLDYKKLAKTDDEIIKTIRFRKPTGNFYFNFEKVCKRTYLDIASVNTAISLTVESVPGPGWIPPALSISDLGSGTSDFDPAGNPENRASVDHKIIDVHVSAGGVGPIPLYLKKTSELLRGMPVNEQTIADADEIMQSEISPISDVRGSADYKRLLLRQLFRAHFVELFAWEVPTAETRRREENRLAD